MFDFHRCIVPFDSNATNNLSHTAPTQIQPMKTKQILAILTVLSLFSFASISRAVDIVATGSGNWTSTNADAPWPGGVVPGTNDDADIEAPFNVTVDSTASVQFIYGSGTVTMAPGSTLNVVGDPAGARGTFQLTGLLDTSAAGNTVIYSGNPFWAKHQNYYNLVFSNTVTTNQIDFYNGLVNSTDPSVPMTIAGDMTVVGKIKVQLGDDMTINGNLTLSTNAQLDCSLTNLIVMGNTTLGTGALLLDLDGANGTNYFGGSVTVSATAIGWNVSDVTTWDIGGSLTNNGLIVGKGYGSISFDGTGNITGTKPIKIPTMTVNGTYTIGTTITLITNTPTLNGTLVFDLANTNEIVLLTNAGTALYYSGNLNVINSGAPPVAGNSYKLFNAPSYGGAFASTNLPALTSGLSWVDNTLVNGSFAVISSGPSSPFITLTRSGGLLTLSWDSTNFPGYSVQGQTNSGGISTNWGPTGSGTNSPFTIAINPTNRSVFFRLSNP